MYTEMENFEKQDFFGVCTQEKFLTEEESAYFLRLVVKERPKYTQHREVLVFALQSKQASQHAALFQSHKYGSWNVHCAWIIMP